jgi:CDGSH-type Zn-finger protein
MNSHADADRATITPYPNGPLIVRGSVDIVDPDGVSLVSERHSVALCRCGLSTIKPLCDGSHKTIEFRTEEA